MNKNIDFNSVVNQEIKRKFVSTEVYTCFSYEMDEILSKGVLQYDDIKNLFYFDTENVIYKIMENYDLDTMNEYANNPDTFNRRCKNNSDFEVFLNSLDDTELSELAEYFNIDIDDDSNTPHTVFEWWIVSEYLYRKLKEKGFPVLEWGNNYYWGRCTTGQAISLDYVISKICEDMEILEGQKYDWSK